MNCAEQTTAEILRSQNWPFLDDVSQWDRLSPMYRIRDSRWFLMVSDGCPWVLDPEAVPDMALTERLQFLAMGTPMSPDSAHEMAAWIRAKTAPMPRLVFSNGAFAFVDAES